MWTYLDMPLSKLALQCLESSAYFTYDILNLREGVDEENKKRYLCGEFRRLYREYRKRPEKFYEYTRMSVKTFDYILENIKIRLPIKSKRVVTNAEKLFLTLRYLSQGMSLRTLSHSYRLGRSTVARTIYQTLNAIWKAFTELYMPQPTQESLKKISEEFFEKWQFPNCIGSIDENHFRILKETKKKHFSLVLQAISDADYKFLAIEVCNKDLNSHGGTFHSSMLKKMLNNNRFNVPPPQKLPHSEIKVPYVLVGNEAYPLQTYLLRPYPSVNLDREKKIFNERLTRARVTIERALGIMTNKWRILINTLETNTKHAKLIIKVACVLHNIVRQKDGNKDQDYRNIVGKLAKSKKSIRSKRNNRSTSRAMAIRDKYKNYFVNNLT